MSIAHQPDQLGSFETEWGLHKGCREWWYATGVMFDDDKNLYSYQYTLLYLSFGIVTAKMAMIALTDFQNNRHYYLQCPSSRKEAFRLTAQEASLGNVAAAVKKENGIALKLNHKDFSLDLFADYGKGAFWHCDNGKLQMGMLTVGTLFYGMEFLTSFPFYTSADEGSNHWTVSHAVMYGAGSYMFTLLCYDILYRLIGRIY